MAAGGLLRDAAQATTARVDLVRSARLVTSPSEPRSGRRRANQTFVGRVFLEGATITRGGGASSVAARRAGRPLRRRRRARAPERGRARDAATRPPATPRLSRRVPRVVARRDRVGSRRTRATVRTRARARSCPLLYARAFFSQLFDVRACSTPHRVSLARVVSGARAYRDAPPSEHARPRRRRRGARGDALARSRATAATRADVMLLATALLSGESLADDVLAALEYSYFYDYGYFRDLLVRADGGAGPRADGAADPARRRSASTRTTGGTDFWDYGCVRGVLLRRRRWDDDDDFTAGDLCCACGGGSFSTTAAPSLSPTFSPAPTISCKADARYDVLPAQHGQRRSPL